jgi:ubiquinone/menaquinone biosynthesis C-methylase UbiE
VLDDRSRSSPTGEEIYSRPDDYDLEHASDAEDARFYGYLLRRLHPVRVLELACGSGRVLASLAAALPGAELTGVDDSEEMLAQSGKTLTALQPRARERITLVQGDMRTWDGAGARFDAVLIGCCSVSHLLTMDDRLQTWRRVFDLLEPGGAFLMDVAMPDLATLAESQRIAPRAVLQLDVDASRRNRGGSARLLRCTATVYDAHEQRANVRFFYDRFESSAPDERFVSDFPSHVYFPSELELLFATTGFEIMQRYGDYAFGPLGRSSPYLITLARRPSA